MLAAGRQQSGVVVRRQAGWAAAHLRHVVVAGQIVCLAHRRLELAQVPQLEAAVCIGGFVTEQTGRKIRQEIYGMAVCEYTLLQHTDLCGLDTWPGHQEPAPWAKALGGQQATGNAYVLCFQHTFAYA